MFDLNSSFYCQDSDILREINETELKELENLYKNQSKDLKYHFLNIYNQRIWNEKLKNISENDKIFNKKPFFKKFLTHRNGDLFKNGTYFSIAIDCKITITCHTLQSTFKEFTECLEKTQMIDWKAGPLFAGLHYKIMPIVENIVNNKDGVIERNRECIFYLYDNEDAQNITFDKNQQNEYKLRSLSTEDVEVVHNLWPNKKEGSVDFLKGLTVLNLTAGMFFKNSNVGWIFQNEFAGIGILHIVTEHRRKGLAKVLTERLTKEIAISDKNIDVSAFTVHDNLNSRSLLEKIGYKKVINTFWMQLVNIENQTI